MVIAPVSVCLVINLPPSQGYEEEEADAFDVNLTKNAQGLGITIAGYVGDKNSGDDDHVGEGPESLLWLLTVLLSPQSPLVYL